MARMIDAPRVLSLFSGIEGLGLGLEAAGMRVVGQVEIEPLCIRILERHFPGVKRHGDIQTFRGERESADVVCGGSPCQDISVAGKRAGLAGTRSRLFHEFVRVADDVAPEWVLFENVDGLLSSGSCSECKAAGDTIAGHDHVGADFQVVLREFTGFEPEIPEGGWRSSGICVGPKRSAAWRLFDSQYFGVAQRRHRLFLVGHARARRAFEVLHEPESCNGDHPPRDEASSEFAGFVDGGVAKPLGSVTGSIRTTDLDFETYVPHTASALRAEGHDASEDGTGRQPAHVVYRMQAFGQYEEDRKASTLKACDHKDATDLVVTQPVANALTASGGPGTKSSPSRMMDEDANLVAVFRKSRRAADPEDDETWVPAEVANTINTFDEGDVRSTELVVEARDDVRVRRLTVTERERLQGFPDGWTCLCGADPYSSMTCTCPDGPRARALGNAVTTTIPAWIGRRMLG